SFTVDGKVVTTAKLVVDPDKDPPAVDLRWTSGGASGHTSLGIYRLGEDKLEICWNDARGKEKDKRPTKFTTKPAVGSGNVLWVFVRQGAKSEDKKDKKTEKEEKKGDKEEAEAKKPPKGWEEYTPKNKAYVAWFPSEGEVKETDKSLQIKGAGQLRFF